MTYEEAKQVAVKNGHFIKRKTWVFTRVGYDKTRQSFFIERTDEGRRKPYTPTKREKQVDDWIRA